MRHCDACDQDVHLTHDAEGVWRLARAGQCVAHAPTRTVGVFLPPAADHLVVGWLVVLDGPAAGTTFRLGARAVIGSAPDADVVLADPAIAAAHGRIERTSGDFVLVAIDRAEVVANGAPVTRHELVDGDQLVLGSTRLVFKAVD